MSDKSVRFPWMVHAYVWVFLIALGLAPVISVLLRRRYSPVSLTDWVSAIMLMAVIQALFLYSQKRCSSDKLSYWNGLLYVAAFMSTGWSYLSMVFVFPTLLIVFIASITLSIYYDLAPSRVNAAFQFHRIVSFFYKNRMVQ
jgi:hypothetical protein